MKKFSLFPLIILSFVFLFSSCGRKQSGTDSQTQNTTSETPLAPVDVSDATRGDWIIQQELADPEKLNPLVSNDATATEIAGYMYDRLLSTNRETYELMPSIAKALPEESPDHLTYTFDLKENVTFSDGKPLTGEDVIFTLKVIKNPFTDSQSLRNYFADVKNVELVDGNKYKVKFTMSKPYFLAVYQIGDLDITPKHILDPNNENDKFTFTDFEAAAKNFDPKKYPEMQKYADFINSQEVARSPKYVVGSGPYKLTEWVTGTAVTLTRNDNFWNKDKVSSYPDRLVFKTIQDQTAAVTAAKNKEIDNMNVIRDIDFVENLKNAEEFGLKKYLVARPTYAYIAWNSKRPFFADKKVRLALSHLVDRKTLIDKILYGMATPIQSHIYYKSDYLNKNLPIIEYDIEKAKKLLDEAGWKDSDGDGIRDKMVDGKKVDFKFTFVNNNNPQRKQVVLVVIESLKQAGIQADIQDYEWSVFLDKLDKHEFDACYGAWVLSVIPPDPYQLFHSSQSRDEGSNYVSFGTPESDKILEQNRTEFDEAKRREMMMRWQEIVYEEQPYTFLWTPSSKFVTSDRFKNVRWFAYPYPNQSNEWWAPATAQRYKGS